MPRVELLTVNRFGAKGDQLELSDADAAGLVCVGEAIITRYGPPVSTAAAPKEIQDELNEGPDTPSRRPARRRS